MEAYLHGVSTRKVDDLVKAHDEWQVSAERRYLLEGSMALVAPKPNPEG